MFTWKANIGKADATETTDTNTITTPRSQTKQYRDTSDSVDNTNASGNSWDCVECWMEHTFGCGVGLCAYSKCGAKERNRLTKSKYQQAIGVYKKFPQIVNVLSTCTILACGLHVFIECSVENRYVFFSLFAVHHLLLFRLSLQILSSVHSLYNKQQQKHALPLRWSIRGACNKRWCVFDVHIYIQVLQTEKELRNVYNILSRKLRSTKQIFTVRYRKYLYHRRVIVTTKRIAYVVCCCFDFLLFRLLFRFAQHLVDFIVVWIGLSELLRHLVGSYTVHCARFPLNDRIQRKNYYLRIPIVGNNFIRFAYMRAGCHPCVVCMSIKGILNA